MRGQPGTGYRRDERGERRSKGFSYASKSKRVGLHVSIDTEGVGPLMLVPTAPLKSSCRKWSPYFTIRSDITLKGTRPSKLYGHLACELEGSNCTTVQ